MRRKGSSLATLVASLVLAHGGLHAEPPAAKATATAQAAPATAGSPFVQRIGDYGFLRVEAPSFGKLTLQQKLLAYHLQRAAIQLDPIFYDQMSTYGITAKRLLGALVEDPSRLPASSRDAIVEYATLFFGNSGNHNATTGEKFLPRFSYDDFARTAEEARDKGAHLGTAQQLARVLATLRAPLFDAAYQPILTQKTPPAGQDILTASGNNYYSGVTLADLKGFHEEYPLDSRLVKKDGRLVEEVYRAG